MAKQKLYGNRTEPRCETCALGKRSSDGSTVLCRRVGAVPLYHHCRRYEYDPLRRTPHRDPALINYSAADFALDDPTVEMPAAQTATDPADVAALDRLREYLSSSDDPNVETILELLDRQVGDESRDAVSDAPTLEELLADLPEDEAAVETAPSSAEEAEEFSDTEISVVEIAEDATQAAAEGEAEKAADIPEAADDSPDIFGDLDRMTEQTAAAMRAAFNNASFELSLLKDYDDDSQILDPQFDDLARRLAATSTLSLPDEEEDLSPLSNDGHFLSISREVFRDNKFDELTLNPDGSFGVIPAKD